MKIDIYSHSSSFGGAESALHALIELLSLDHEIRVFLPKMKGELFEILKKNNIEILKHKFSACLPHAHRIIDRDIFFAGQESISPAYENLPDLIICNTITLPHIIIHANSINIPCIVYAHEYIDGDPDLTPNGCSSAHYLNQIYNFSSHIICASEFVATQFKKEKTSVLYPFDNINANRNIKKNTPIKKLIIEWVEKFFTISKKINEKKLLAIGNKSSRKNFSFSLGVHKSLSMRGINQTLLIIGNSGTTSSFLKKIIRKRNIKRSAYLINELSNPYHYSNGQPINLISSTVEPFGLTVIESLSRGIPVVSSKCGGPEEILPNKYIYENNNYDHCTRILEEVWKNYNEASNEALRIFEEFSQRNTLEKRKSSVSAAIHKSKSEKFETVDLEKYFSKPHTDTIEISEIIKNISAAANSRNISIDIEKITDLIEKEIKNPGTAIREDIQKFNVIPFAHSKEMDNLYRSGIGLGIELAAYHDDIGKRRMLNFIILSMKEHQSKSQKPLRVLCLGDGLGLDSITFSASGFNIDYMDYDNSTMSECAKLNIEAAMKMDGNIHIDTINQVTLKYDCIICLEVIEHVPDPKSFMEFMSNSLNSDGILFLSECFDGIEDRWPTHLYANEQYAGSITEISEEYFSLIDINLDPMLKPLVFKRRTSPDCIANKLTKSKKQIFLKHSAKFNS